MQNVPPCMLLHGASFHEGSSFFSKVFLPSISRLDVAHVQDPQILTRLIELPVE